MAVRRRSVFNLITLLPDPPTPKTTTTTTHTHAVVLLESGGALWASAATHTQGLQPLALPDPKGDPAVEAACSADRVR